MAALKITNGSGIHLTFENGWTASVQIGPGTYSDNYNASFIPLEGRRFESSTVEVARFKPDGGMERFDNDDTVMGRLSIAELLAFLNATAAKS